MDLTTYGFDDNYESYEESMEGLKDVLTNFLNNRQNKIFDTKGFYNTMKALLDENTKLRTKVQSLLKKYKSSETNAPKELPIILNTMKKEAATAFKNNRDMFDKYCLPMGLFETISRYKDDLDHLDQERIDRRDNSSQLKMIQTQTNSIFNQLTEAFASTNKFSFENLIWINNLINHGIGRFHALNKMISDADNFIKITENPKEVEKIKKHPYIAEKYDLLVKASKEIRLTLMNYVKSIMAINKCLLKMIKIFTTTDKIVGFANKFKKPQQKMAVESLEDEIFKLLDMCIGIETQSIEEYGFIIN